MKLPPQEKIQDVAFGVVGILLFLIAWEYIGRKQLAGLTWPPLSTVLSYLTEFSRRALFLRASEATFSMVVLGYVTGAVLGLTLAGLAHVLRPLSEGLGRLSSVVNSIPAIALAPLFIVLINANWAGMAIATLNVYFVIYVAASSGLTAASRAHHDLFTTFGASGVGRFQRLELPGALPALVSGLKYAVPASFIGVIVGEWFGASRGLGLLMVSAMQNFQIPLLWSAVVITAAGSLTAFGLMSLVERHVYARYRT